MLCRDQAPDWVASVSRLLSGPWDESNSTNTPTTTTPQFRWHQICFLAQDSLFFEYPRYVKPSTISANIDPITNYAMSWYWWSWWKRGIHIQYSTKITSIFCWHDRCVLHPWYRRQRLWCTILQRCRDCWFSTRSLSWKMRYHPSQSDGITYYITRSISHISFVICYISVTIMLLLSVIRGVSYTDFIAFWFRFHSTTILFPVGINCK